VGIVLVRPALALAAVGALVGAGSAAAAPKGPVLVAAPAGPVAFAVDPVGPSAPVAPADPAPPSGDPTVSIDINGIDGTPSSPVVVLLTITLLSVAPSLLLMMTSFTKIFVVLALTRNALGMTGVPPNQVLAGLALFLSLFIMAPVVGDVNETAVQPYLAGATTFSEAVEVGSGPLREFMLGQTREADLALITRAADLPNPESPETVSMTTLIPAFMLSELRRGFEMGFLVVLPFLVIDLIVATLTMSMGMMMLPPTVMSLPFKVLFFVLIDGWNLLIGGLVRSFP